MDHQSAGSITLTIEEHTNDIRVHPDNVMSSDDVTELRISHSDQFTINSVTPPTIFSNSTDSSCGGSDVVVGVCRDFLRNVCVRGKRCRFLHSSSFPSPKLSIPKRRVTTTLTFCHDFQNKGHCRRSNCQFVHCSKATANEYQKLVAQRLQTAIIGLKTPRMNTRS